jgi:hypothetical protein
VQGNYKATYSTDGATAVHNLSMAEYADSVEGQAEHAWVLLGKKPAAATGLSSSAVVSSSAAPPLALPAPAGSLSVAPAQQPANAPEAPGTPAPATPADGNKGGKRKAAGSATVSLLPTTHYPYYLLPTTYYLLPATYYLLPTTYCLPTTNAAASSAEATAKPGKRARGGEEAAGEAAPARGSAHN